MEKLSWYWRLTLFFILELLLGEVVIGYGTRLLHLLMSRICWCIKALNWRDLVAELVADPSKTSFPQFKMVDLDLVDLVG
jgi:hypothetical protein